MVGIRASETGQKMHDMVILGGGPAGVTAALRARELGASVALIERGTMGGTCTNDGCVPTRVLAKAARLMRDVEQFSQYGLILNEKPTVDFPEVLKRTQQVVYQVHEKKQLLDHLARVGVDVLSQAGNASFADAQHIRLEDGRLIDGAQFVLCVGGHARRLNLPGIEHTLLHSDVWTMDKLPESVVIVGGGATGCQLASIFDSFGSSVTLLDIAPRILLAEDLLVAETMAHELGQRGIHIITGIDKIERVDLHNRLKHLVFSQAGEEHTLIAESVLMSVGWPGNIDHLNLDAAGVAVERGYVQVNDALQTSAPHIYAAGDITGKMMLVQSAGYQARVAVENALNHGQQKAQHRLVPHGGFTDPEYGSVGVTEQQVTLEQAAVVTVHYADMDRAVIDGLPVGFCKLVVDRGTRQIIGAHVVGEQAVEVVQMITAGMAGNLRVEQYAELEFAYPTFAAIVGLAARQLAQELGVREVAPEWRVLNPLDRRGSEWERRSE
jgi:pyruvate/2-oxoglutarate dehydrogenase complex dihydrolipoamide dehydrogenase (E3) component